MNDDALKLDNQLCFPLYAAARRITKLYRPVLDPLGLTYTQYITMLALWERDGVTVTDLGKRLFLDSGTLTPLLKRLDQQGLVTRVRGAEDERVVTVHLTERGRAMKAQAAEVPARVASCVNLSLADGRELHRLLHALLAEDAVREYGAEGNPAAGE